MGITTDVHGFCVHALRATAATNALAHNADITKVQEVAGACQHCYDAAL
jgi:integrase/recombinase XerD